MRYNFSESVRRVLGHAMEVAREHGVDYLGTEHILVALSREGDGPAAELLRALGVDAARLEQEVLGLSRRGTSVLGRSERPYTSRAKKVLEYAMASARELAGDEPRGKAAAGVDTDHLLMGLVRESKGIAAKTLESFGATEDAVREAARRRRRGAPPEGILDGASTGSPREAAWFLQIDPGSSTPIYEQIVARIEEAVATNRLAPGERLPPVRDLAAELEVAPGTVARAYSALEQRGVLETRGARGTHVAERPPRPEGNGDLQAALADLLRPVAVAAYHMGARAEELRRALDLAMKGILS